MSNRKSPITTKASAALRVCRCCAVALVAAFALIIISCEREPMLHLHRAGGDVNIDLPIVQLELDVFWNYELDYGIEYDWKAEWYYGDDPALFKTIGYTAPASFWLRRYYTQNDSCGPHTYVPQREYVDGYTYTNQFNWGYWDLLAQSTITPDADGLVATDYAETPDSVVYYASQTMHPVRRNSGSRFTRAFNQPEEIFAGYDAGEYIDPELKGFTWNEERQAWVKMANLTLHPRTYIYLTQVILHNNRGRVDGIDGNATLTGMARSVNITTGKGGNDAISVYYNVGMKRNVEMLKDGIPFDTADIMGGRVMTFGLCNINPSQVEVPRRGKAAYPESAVLGYIASGHPLYVKNNEVHVDDGQQHLMDVTMTFTNGNDSTFIFDVTEQVRRRYKGGVITVELDMDTVNIPSRSGGSGFDAVVVAPDSVTYEFEM